MKRRLRAHIALGCPLADADAVIEAFFAAHRGADGITRLQLRVPLEGLAIVPDVALKRVAKVQVRPGRDEENLNDIIKIEWEAEGGGPFPTFAGKLTTWSEHDPKESFVELDGWYEPPLGDVGEVFEDAIGHEIARRTARAFLEDLAAAAHAARDKTRA